MKQKLKHLLQRSARVVFVPIRVVLHGRMVSARSFDIGTVDGVDKHVELPNDRFLPEVRRVINEGHTATIRVKGYSMRPFLEHCRDKVVLAPVETVKVGDAVLAEIAKGVFVLHRIIRIDGDTITLMGDGNIVGTEECQRKDVVGIVKIFVRNNKSISTESRRWKVYSAIWPKLRPIRRYLLYIYKNIR